MSTLTVGSLFAGIGGFDLGLERAGMEVKWQVEIDPWCRRVLEKHWPHVRRYEDVRTVGAELERVDVLCGGFPCQDISTAGPGVGISGPRSGLWSEFSRLIGELQPDYVVVENVSALLVRGIERVLGDLAEGGYDAEWDCLPAVAFGAPHRRDRVWIVAYPAASRTGRSEQDLPLNHECLVPGWPEMSADFDRRDQSEDVADPDNQRQLQPQRRVFNERGRISDSDWWRVEPDVARVAYGLPGAVDRIAALGNAIVPQIAEWIGRRIVDAEAQGMTRQALPVEQAPR